MNDVEQLLRDTLEDAARSYEPRGDGLSKIRSRVAARRRWRRWMVPTTSIAGLAAVLVAILLAAPALLPGPSRHTLSPTGGDTAAPQTTQTTQPTPTASPGATGRTHAVAIYYTGSTGLGQRLFREFHSEPVSRSPIQDAVNAMLRERPLDPDYRSAWPAGTRLLGVSRHGTEVTVDLSAAAQHGLAAQQLYWTVAAADPQTTAVRLLVSGMPSGSPVTRAAATDVLAPVWVITPASGATVNRTFTASGSASVFEATVAWQLRRADGSVVREGSVTASVGAPGRGTWGPLRLTAPAPGTYTFVAYASSPKDGSMLAADSKTVTVR